MERASSQLPGAASEPSMQEAALSLAHVTTLHRRPPVVNSQPRLLSVPQTLSPLTSLPKISTKGQSRQSLVTPSQEYFTPRRVSGGSGTRHK